MPGEGITVRIELTDGYFSQKKDIVAFCILGIMLLLTAMFFIIWYFIGKDAHVTPVVSFYPPANYNSAEIDLIYSGRATEKGLFSLIVWMANQGYISISEHKNKTIEKIDGFSVVYEFSNILFGVKNTISDRELEKSTSFYKNAKSACLLLMNSGSMYLRQIQYH